MIPRRGAENAERAFLQYLEKKFPNIGKKLSGEEESFNKMMNSKIISNSWIKKSFP